MENQPHAIWINWAPREEKFGVLMQKIYCYLILLRQIHPAFQHWHLLSDGYVPVAANLLGLFKLISQDQRPLKQHRHFYQNLDNNFDIVAETTSVTGFCVTFYTLGKDCVGEVDWEIADVIKLRIVTAQVGANIVLEFPGGREKDLVQADMLKEILTRSIDFWHANNAQALALAATEWFPKFYSPLRATWMSYFRHALLAQCIKPDIGCKIERFADDGLFFTMTPHSPDPNNAEDRSRAFTLQAQFDEFHFNHPFVYYGWPFDLDESRYAAQITGTPESMAYAVGFAAFDGYDAERQILLTARLFKYPPGWEPDLHPIYATNAERLESLPYVVLARHQIAAVRYVGANTPIEWHIGIAKHADILKVLINDWAAIPAEQLRIVYTPISNPSCNS